MQSAWFQGGKMNCLAEWLAHLFELQISDAYINKTKHKFQAYQFAQHLYDSIEFEKLLRLSVKKYCSKKQKSEQQTEEQNYYYSQALVRIKESQNPIETLLQYDWKLQNKQSPFHQILLILAEQIDIKLKQYKQNKWIQEVQAIKSKKKKKNNKKKLKNSNQLLKNMEQTNTLHSSKLQQQINQLQQTYRQAKQNISTQLHSKAQENSDQHQQERQDEYIMIPQTHIVSKKNQQKNQKQIIKKINEHLQLFAAELLQQGNSQQHYKKCAIEQIRCLFHEMNLKTTWELKVYGSSAIGFALKQSDIDLLLIVNQMITCFQQVLIQLKSKKWVFDCQFIKTAFVPIIKFRVHLIEIETIEMSNKQFKKLQNTFFSVDLTICSEQNISPGIANTQYMKELFQKYMCIQKTAIIIKYYLRKKGLNHPFKGGINSFTIVVLIYGILKYKKMLLNSSIYKQIVAILEFMTEQFQPFITIIKTKTNNYTKFQQIHAIGVEQVANLHLKIEDPIQEGYLKTSAFKINDIIICLNELKHWLLDLKTQLCKEKLNERKKLKKMILSSLDRFFQGNNGQCFKLEDNFKK